MRDVRKSDMVREFMVAMGQPVDQPYDIPLLHYTPLRELRDNLLREEFIEAVGAQTKAELLKELCDLLYVTYGYAVTYGLDIDTAFNRVHKSNLSKLGSDGKPIYREDGKVLKSENYKPADLSDLV